MFTKILIANRGEIARRIIVACQEMGIQTVAIYSDVDSSAIHVHLADEVYPLGDPTPKESYLHIEKIISIAKGCGAEAIHPGYGFLSENPEFAQRCVEEGIFFIGPNPEAIRAMGDKVEAKKIMMEAGVPTIPGYHGGNVEPTYLMEKAREISFPVMIKATAGGGGRGMRIVHTEKNFLGALESAQREAESAFGDGRLFLEKYIDNPRHIEFQILADYYGNIIHLFERECSIQRRHQKIIEETPSVVVTPELRERMGETAIRAARKIGYVNAGTVEFILTPENEFYFVEMNTRLQVEHGITEATTGIDIVKWQIKIANGENLTFKQEDLVQRGHAIESRIYAEDPEHNFLPHAGRIQSITPPTGVNIRNDMGVESGEEVSIFYDPLISKLIVHGEDREDALEKMSWALSNYAAIGIVTNLDFLQEVINHKEFQNGNITTHFIEKYFSSWNPPKTGVPTEALLAASLFDVMESELAIRGVEKLATNEPDPHSPWKLAGRWRQIQTFSGMKTATQIGTKTIGTVGSIGGRMGKAATQIGTKTIGTVGSIGGRVLRSTKVSVDATLSQLEKKTKKPSTSR